VLGVQGRRRDRRQSRTHPYQPGVTSEESSDAPSAVSLQVAHVRDNPYESVLRMQFDVGGVGYGRIDYAILGDSLETWEINTNPTMIWSRAEQRPLSTPRQNIFLSRLSCVRFDRTERSRSIADHARIRSLGTPVRVPGVIAIERAVAQRRGRKCKQFMGPAGRVVEGGSIPFERQILERWKRRNAT